MKVRPLSAQPGYGVGQTLLNLIMKSVLLASNCQYRKKQGGHAAEKNIAPKRAPIVMFYLKSNNKAGLKYFHMVTFYTVF